MKLLPRPRRRRRESEEEKPGAWAGLDGSTPFDTSPRRPQGPPRPGPRGWAVPGGGRATYLQPPPQFRGTTVQVCGLWPWSTGAGAPMVGVPLGRHLFSGATVCCDPINWFRRTNLIDAPSAFMLGDPGLGKSKTVSRMVIGLAGQGVVPMVLGDLRPDYVELIDKLGGQVIRLGPGRSVLNVLDPGETLAAVRRLRAAGHERKARELLADAERRRLTMVTALLTISRGTPPTDSERTILSRALRLLDARRPEGGPASVLGDVYSIIDEAPEELQHLTVNRGDMARYRLATEGLLRSLRALMEDDLGQMLGGHTTDPIDLAAHPGGVVFDVSAISDVDQSLQGAALMACWSTGFATINAAHALADAGLEPRRFFFAVLDELHRALRAGAGMVDRVDLLTRLNRKDGAGYVMITHTMSDLQAIPDPADVAKARGLIARSKIKLIGGLSDSEIVGGQDHPGLRSVVRFTQAEQDLVTGWATPSSWSTTATQGAPPPGRGKFLIKVGQRPGIPVQVLITSVEHAVSDTNAMWRPDPGTPGRLQAVLAEQEDES